MKRVVYKAAPGAPFPKKKATVIGRYLERVERKAGAVTPEEVVKEARDPDSPLHPYFEWDDTEAAKEYRLWQARSLINHLIVVIKTPEGDIDTKGWHSVRITMGDESGRGYASMATVQDSYDLKEQVVAQAVKEIKYWQMRYGQYEELFELDQAITKATKRMKAAAHVN